MDAVIHMIQSKIFLVDQILRQNPYQNRPSWGSLLGMAVSGGLILMVGGLPCSFMVEPHNKDLLGKAMLSSLQYY